MTDSEKVRFIRCQCGFVLPDYHAYLDEETGKLCCPKCAIEGYPWER